MKDKPNKVTTVLKVVVTGEFYDDDATGETLRYVVEQDLEDAGFDVDVTPLKDEERKPPLGVKPFYVAAWQRIGELIGAIERQYESGDGDTKLVQKWANEIGWQATIIESLRSEQDEQP